MRLFPTLLEGKSVEICEGKSERLLERIILRVLTRPVNTSFPLHCNFNTEGLKPNSEQFSSSVCEFQSLDESVCSLRSLSLFFLFVEEREGDLLSFIWVVHEKKSKFIAKIEKERRALLNGDFK